MEDFILTTQFLTEFDFVTPKEYKVRAIIFLVESTKINGLFEQELLGKKMKNWVLDAVKPLETTFVNLNKNEDFYEKAKQNIKDEDFTICLFSDTPLLKNSTIMEVIDYAQTKDLDFCKLLRGFIVKSKSFISGNITLSAEANFVSDKEFFTVYDENTLCIAKEKLRKQILEFHLKNGVRLEDFNTISIDSNVKIEKNVIIEQNNIIVGNSIIKEGVVLKPYNFIKNSVIGENCIIYYSYIENFNLNKNSKVGPFEKLVKCKEKK